jgi:hypothetical protein
MVVLTAGSVRPHWSSHYHGTTFALRFVICELLLKFYKIFTKFNKYKVYIRPVLKLDKIALLC